MFFQILENIKEGERSLQREEVDLDLEESEWHCDHHFSDPHPQDGVFR